MIRTSIAKPLADKRSGAKRLRASLRLHRAASGLVASRPRSEGSGGDYCLKIVAYGKLNSIQRTFRVAVAPLKPFLMAEKMQWVQSNVLLPDGMMWMF